ncbi:MAG: potassium transporter [Odoribacter sp.]|nr:potassium transporter [Odoribacter sp.]
MINFRIIARVFSLMLIIEGLCMFFSALISLVYNEPYAKAFIYSGLITSVTGIIVFSPLRNEDHVYGKREGYIIVTGIWVIFTLFATLPFLFSGTITSFTDAFFEAMSGFTTTGATIVTNIEGLPHGILFWRSLIQWLGGIGIIILSLSLLPVFKDINVQISTTDFTGQPSDKIHPKIKETGKRLVLIYILITLTEAIILTFGGMTVFDAVCHSFTTMSTGGFSTHNEGIAAFSSPFIKVVLSFFMFIAGTNMAIIYFGLKANFRKIFNNSEFIYYLIICFVFSVIVSAILLQNTGLAGKSILDGTFHVISIITTTGFYTNNYSLWSNFLVLIFFVLMFTGGTAGSTSGGIKIVRLMIMTKNNRMELRRLLHPNAFIPVRLNHKTVPQIMVYNVLVFVTLYFLIFCLSAMVISLMGYDIITSFGASAAMLGNIGPGLGTLGPFSNYSAVPEAGKWFMSLIMLLGRLELITVLILFSRSFYRR